MDDHDGRSGRATSCLIAAVGSIVFIGGAISMLTHVPRLWPDLSIDLFWKLNGLPIIIEGDVGYLPSVGIIVVGLVLLGRKRLADKLISASSDVKERVLPSESE